MIPIDNSYSTLWTFVFVLLMYSAGLPMLYAFAALCIFILYWVDKYLTLRHYSNPPRLDERFIAKNHDLIPWTILLHFAFAILIYGSVDLAPPDETDYPSYF